MTTVRRIFSVAAIAIALIAAPLAVLSAAGPKTKPRTAKAYRAYVGNYTTKTSSQGIYQFTFDPANGKCPRSNWLVKPKIPRG